jgi:hypothetical protein
MDRPKPDTARILGALLKRVFPDGMAICLSIEEIDSAPEVEMKEFLDQGRIELRTQDETFP